MFSMIVIGCAGMQVKGENLSTEYYQTYEDVTERIYPDVDWPFIVDTNQAEPIHIDTKYVWVNYDSNKLGLHYYDTNGVEEDGCAIVTFDDVSPITGPDWKELQPSYFQVVYCETLDSELAVALGKGE